MADRKLVAAAYLKILDATGPTEIDRHSFPTDGGGKIAVEVIRIGFPYADGTEVTFCGTIGDSGDAETGHYFVSLSDGSPFDTSTLAAAAHDYDRDTAVLAAGHTFPLSPKSSLRAHGFTSAIVLDASIYAPFEDAEELEQKLGCHFLAVVPITADELSLKKQRGLDGLLESWNDAHRDILSWRGTTV
jgi:Suppressor of fused protein (SUFU)